MGVSKPQGEQCSIVTMYYLLTQKVSMGETTGKWENWMDKKLPKGISSEYIKALDSILGKGKSVKEPEWVNTWINQAIEIQKYLKSKNALNKKWMYGWFDGGKTFKGIPGGKTTDSLTCVWKIFEGIPEIKSEFNSQKDNWNPADTYLVTVEVATKIHPWCIKLKEKFVDGGGDWKKFVGTVNARMSNLVKSNQVVPISLKKQTSKVSMKYKVTNVNPINGTIDVVKGDFTHPPYCYFEVSDRNGKCDFRGNSFLFKASIQTGAYKDGMEYQDDAQYYKIEQRMQKTSNKQEVKDIKTTDQGKFKDANAQAGNMPVKKFKELVTEYAKSGTYDKDIPKIGTPLTKPQIKFWADEYDKISGQSRVDMDLGSTTISGVKYSTLDYFIKLSELDQADDNEVAQILGVDSIDKGTFSAKLRNKLCNLRFMRAILNAKKSDDLCMFLTKIYYGATKQKMSDKDLQGPFIKIS